MTRYFSNPIFPITIFIKIKIVSYDYYRVILFQIVIYIYFIYRNNSLINRVTVERFYCAFLGIYGNDMQK